MEARAAETVRVPALRRCVRRCALLAISLACTSPITAGAQLRRGDVVVSQPGALVRVDPETGVAMPLVGAPLVAPEGVLALPDGDLVVADWQLGGVPTIWRVDPLSGDVRVLRQGAPMETPFALAARPDGRVVFADIDSGTHWSLPTGGVIRQGVLYDLDVTSGALAPLVADCCAWNPTALVVDTPSHAWAVDAGCCAYADDGDLVSVDLDAGTWTTVATDLRPKDPFGIVVDPVRGDLIYTESGSPQHATPAVLRVAPSDGTVRPVVAGAPLVRPMGLVLDDDGHVLVADAAAVRRIALADGATTTVASGTPLEQTQALARYDVGRRVAGRPPPDPGQGACAERTSRRAAQFATKLLGCRRATGDVVACRTAAVRRFAASPVAGCAPCVARNRKERATVLDAALDRLVAPLLDSPDLPPTCAAALLRDVAATVRRRARDDRHVMRGGAVADVPDGATLRGALVRAGCPASVVDAASGERAASASIVDALNGAWYCAR